MLARLDSSIKNNFRVLGIELLRPHEKRLQGAGMNTSLLQLLSRSGGWCEAFDLIPVSFGCRADQGESRSLPSARNTLDSLDSVTGTEHIFDHTLLTRV